MVLINRMIGSTKELVPEEHRGSRPGRGCIDQIFVLKQLVKKYREKRKELHAAFMGLEKAYDKVCREKLNRRKCSTFSLLG